jgi:uncharacterized OB-fold protein
MPQGTAAQTGLEARPIAEGLFTWPAAEPQLIGSRCDACAARTFPAQSYCPRCASTAMSEVLLPRTGVLWTWTIQGFRPKSPPYAGGDTVDTFEPFGVGYVDLDGEILVEARLTENDASRLEIGAVLELVLIPLYRDEEGRDVLTYAFRPQEGGE